MKRIITVLLLFAIVLAGCGKGDKYDKDIDKVYKKQEETNKMLPAFGLKVDKKVDRNDSNTYVYKDGKVFVIGVQLSKKVEELNYFTYKMKNGKQELDMDENPLKYKKSHKADYEEENVEVKEK